jgi:hypothetical protein
MSPSTSEARASDTLRPVIARTAPQSAPKSSVVAMPAVERRTPWTRHLPLAVLLAALGALNLAGLPYYMLATAQRVRHPLHPWLKPTGFVGQAAGLGAFALFLFMWLYPLRKQLRFLAFTGSIAKWLNVHVVAGLCIPLLAAMHAAWHFTGLIGLGYAAMMIVVLSGFVGRYLYVRIPHSRSGLEMSLEEIETERKVLLRYVANTAGLPIEEVERVLAPRPVEKGRGSALVALARMATDDLDRWLASRRLARGIRGAAGRPVDRKVLALVRRLARREMGLSQQVRLLDATHEVFRYWHVAHRPVAISALLAVAIHVVVAVAMGVTWFA